MAPQPMLTQGQVAEMLNVSAKSVENWRLKGTGPAFYRIEGQVRYEIRDVRAWKRQRRNAKATVKSERATNGL